MERALLFSRTGFRPVRVRCSLVNGDRKMGRFRTIHSSDWKDGFLFVGNQVALDFLNTRPVQNGESMELLPDFSSLLRWLQAAELISARAAANVQQQWGHSAGLSAPSKPCANCGRN
jgi:Putative stress-induced transcription regulator